VIVMGARVGLGWAAGLAVWVGAAVGLLGVSVGAAVGLGATVTVAVALAAGGGVAVSAGIAVGVSGALVLVAAGCVAVAATTLVVVGVAGATDPQAANSNSAPPNSQGANRSPVFGNMGLPPVAIITQAGQTPKL
jgi:hypothetical protein